MKIFAIFLLVNSATAFNMHCTYLNFSYSLVGEVYECSTDFVENPTTQIITNVNGTHLDNKTNADVEMLYIRGHSVLSFVPQGIAVFFPQLSALYITYATFDTLYGDELQDLPNLRLITIRNSNLATISGRLFEETPKIGYVGFYSNKLERVGRNLFTPLNTSNLEFLYFHSNICINSTATGSHERILALIKELKRSCAFEEEEEEITTPTATTEETTTPAIISPTECSIENLEQEVCDLQEELENGKITVQHLTNELNLYRTLTENLQQRLEVLELKILDSQMEIREDFRLLEERMIAP